LPARPEKKCNDEASAIGGVVMMAALFSASTDIGPALHNPRQKTDRLATQEQS
jgi:hypothetical protein